MQSRYVLLMDGLGFLLSLLALEPLPCNQMGSLQAVAVPWKLAALLPRCECLTGCSTWKKDTISFIASPQLGLLSLFSNPISSGDRWKPQSFPRHRVQMPLGLAQDSRAPWGWVGVMTSLLIFPLGLRSFPQKHPTF